MSASVSVIRVSTQQVWQSCRRQGFKVSVIALLLCPSIGDKENGARGAPFVDSG